MADRAKVSLGQARATPSHSFRPSGRSVTGEPVARRPRPVTPCEQGERNPGTCRRCGEDARSDSLLRDRRGRAGVGWGARPDFAAGSGNPLSISPCQQGERNPGMFRCCGNIDSRFPILQSRFPNPGSSRKRIAQHNIGIAIRTGGYHRQRAARQFFQCPQIGARGRGQLVPFGDAVRRFLPTRKF